MGYDGGGYPRPPPMGGPQGYSALRQNGMAIMGGGGMMPSRMGGGRFDEQQQYYPPPQQPPPPMDPYAYGGPFTSDPYRPYSRSMPNQQQYQPLIQPYDQQQQWQQDYGIQQQPQMQYYQQQYPMLQTQPQVYQAPAAIPVGQQYSRNNTVQGTVFGSPALSSKKFGTALGGNFGAPLNDPMAPGNFKSQSALDQALQPFFPRQGEKVSMFRANKQRNERSGFDLGWDKRGSTGSPTRTSPVFADPAIQNALEVKLEQSIKRRQVAKMSLGDRRNRIKMMTEQQLMSNYTYGQGASLSDNNNMVNQQ